MEKMTDTDGDGIPDGAEITKRATGPDGSVTTAKWIKGQMSMTNAAGDNVIRDSQSPAAGSFDSTSMVRTNQPTFSPARLAEMGYTEANAPDYLRPGSSGGTMRMASASEMLGLNAPLESGDPRYEVRRARPGSNFSITRRLSADEMKQASAERFKMMELGSEERRAQVAAQGGIDAAIAGRRQPDPYRPEPVSGPAGFLIPKPGGGWETKFRPQEKDPARPGFSPDGRTIAIPDATVPGGYRYEPAPKASEPEVKPVFGKTPDGREYVQFGDELLFPQQEQGIGQLGLQVPGGDRAPEQSGRDPLEGRTATGPTGQRLVRRGGQWVPVEQTYQPPRK